MKGFIKVASAVPSVSVGNPVANIQSIMHLCEKLDAEGVSLAVFPEMCVTGYTCADLFQNMTLLEEAEQNLIKLVEYSRNLEMTFAVGLPLAMDNTLYNVAVVIRKGKILGAVPKTYIPNYNEFYEKRWWQSAPSEDINVRLEGYDFVMSTRQLFRIGDVLFGIEICEDLWTASPPSCRHSLAGAEIILNLSASDALIGKFDYIQKLVELQSARCLAGYVYASAGFGESSTDLVFDGITLIYDNGRCVARGSRWHNESYYVVADIDLAALRHDRRCMSSFSDCHRENNACVYTIKDGGSIKYRGPFTRKIEPLPFVPSTETEIASRCDEIISIQTAGLAQRLNSTGIKNVVIGVSGGLDSTLALLVAVRAFDRLGLDRKGIHAITMPGFGTTGRTYRNAVELIQALGVSFREINIADAVTLHFRDIGHDAEKKDITYENSQARQRTLLLMDIANQVGGLVVGTGDLSELALGWATYNGDHMSMYGVNVGVPKTLVKYLVGRFADGDAKLIDVKDEYKIADVLHDIVATPISPELIPADENDNITQKTEDLVGPYELHDFFLYYTLRFGLGPDYIYERAIKAFGEKFDSKTILKWLRIFTRRFFNQQFKRSCLPDGPKVGSVCLSPRGDWRMPSDASSATWLRIIDGLEESSADTCEEK